MFGNQFRKSLLSLAATAAIATAGVFLLPDQAPANGTANVATAGQPAAVSGERYVPGIWVDPDGCEHWVMDDGAEGFMTPHVTRNGKPVCRRGRLCGVMPTDQFFANDSYRISASGQQSLREFFSNAGAKGYIISGHTDSNASDSYNLKLSERRANAVAGIARGTGARVQEVHGYGERQPKVSNSTSAGKAKNRRVEIICLR